MKTTIDGTPESDDLIGTAGAEILDGQGAPAGSEDYLQGNGGADTFVYAAGYGHLEVDESESAGIASTATLQLAAGIAAAQVTVTADSSGNVILTDGTSGDRVQIDGMMNLSAGGQPASGVAQIVFADGTVWTRAQVAALVNVSTTGSDTLFGTSGADTFDGEGAPAGGQDYEQGNSGADTFVFDPGYGQLEINESEPADAAKATLQLGAGLTAAQVSVTSDAQGSIVLTDGTTGDRVQIDGMTTLSPSGVPSFGVAQVAFADGTVWTRDQLAALATTGTAGADALYGASGADTFDGKGAPTGSEDYEQGGGGADTFVFDAGYGHLEISESEDYAGTTATAAVLRLGPGITAANVTVTSDGYRVYLTDGTTGDQVQIDGIMDVNDSGVATSGVAQVVFADGTVWSRSQVLILATTGTIGADRLYGGNGAVVFDGKGAPAGSQDYEQSHGGTDTFMYGPGYGQLEIYEGGGYYATAASAATLQLAAGLTASQVQVVADASGNVILTDGITGDRVQIDGMMALNSNNLPASGVAQIVFADGTVWTRDHIAALLNAGTPGADFLYGTVGAEILDGKGAPSGGDDRVEGNSGSDTFVFNAGYGNLEILGNLDGYAATLATSTLQLGSGITPAQVSIAADANGNVILTDGMSGDRVQIDGMMSLNYDDLPSYGVGQILFADGTVWTRDHIVALADAGTNAADYLYGTTGDDTLDGKGAPAGSQDCEQGNGGADTFVFDAGYGHLEIKESEAGNSTAPTAAFLHLGAGISPGQVSVTSDYYGNIFLAIGTAGDRVQIDRMVSPNSAGTPQSGVAQIVFADGTVWTRDHIIALATTGTPGPDSLYGGTGAETFDGKGAPAGSQDYEQGDGGNDTFAFQAGYGQLEIYEAQDEYAATMSTATLRLGTGITAAQVSVTADYNGDVILTDGTTGDRVLIDDMMRLDSSGQSEDGVAQIVFADGTTWTRDQVAALVNAGTTGADFMFGTSAADTFDGKGAPAGTQDYEQGNGGADTFVYKSGYGQLEIRESQAYAPGGSTATLQLGAGITAAQVQVASDYQGNVILTDGMTGDRVQIDGMLNLDPSGQPVSGVAQVVFADGTVWTSAHIVALAATGTPGADSLHGTAGVETFDGEGAPAGTQDYEQGNGGADTFIFDAGYGHLEINESAPYYQYQTVPATATLQLGAGITAAQVSVVADASGNVILTDGTTGDRVQIDGMLNPDYYGTLSSGIAQVVFADGTVWTHDHIIALIDTGTTGADILIGTAGADTLDGKGAPVGSQDLEQGDGGADTFIFDAGYGRLEIKEAQGRYVATPTTATLQLGVGITADQVSVSSDPYYGNITLTIGATGDQVLIDGMMNLNDAGVPQSGVAQVVFADGTVWTRDHVVLLATTGTAGADQLYGTADADTFDGKGAPAGAQDYEQGNGDADTFIYGPGYGQLEISESEGYTATPSATATLQLGAGITTAQVQVSADASGNVILTDGTTGDHVQIDGMMNLDYYGKPSSGVGQVVFADGTVWTRAYITTLVDAGTSGADYLYGTTAAEILDGRGAPAGSQDYGQGNGGADTFVYKPGYGQLEIRENEGDSATVPTAATLQLGAGITAAQVSVTSDAGGNVFLTDGTSGDQVKIDAMLSLNYAQQASYGVAQIMFADGTVWTRDHVIALATTGTPGADNLYGTPGVNTFDGMGAPAGSQDYEQGNGGADTFVYNAGYGALEVNENQGYYYGTASAATFQLGAGITAAQVQVTSDAYGNVFLTDGTTGDRVQIDGMMNLNYGGQPGYGVAQVVFADGTVWTRAQVIALAGTGTTGADTLYGTSGPEVLDGKGAPAGSQDYEQGNGGTDTFVFNAGYGALEVNENQGYYGAASTATLQLGAGITAAQVQATSDAYGNVFLTDGTTGDRVQIDGMVNLNYGGQPGYGVGQVVFADGTVWTRDHVLTLARTGTPGADYLFGTAAADTLDGDGAPAGTQDLVVGHGGADTFIYQAGYGQLELSENQNDAGGGASLATLRLGVGVTAANTSVTQDSYGNVFLIDGTSGDRVQIDAMADLDGNGQSAYGVGQIVFADGTIWTRDNVLALAQSGTLNYSTGDGKITVGAQDGFKVVQLGAGITASDVLLQADGNGDLTVTLRGNTADSLTINSDFYALNNNGVPNTTSVLSAINLADGTSISLAGYTGPSPQPLQFTYVGTAQHTSLTSSFYGANTFILGAGGDQVTGASGFYNAGNTYVFGKGDGHATVLSGGTGVVQLGAGIAASDVLLQADGSGDLTITLKGDTADSLTIDSDLYALNNNGVPNTTSVLAAINLADGSSISLAGYTGLNPAPLQFTYVGTAQYTALTASFYGANTFILGAGGDQVTGASGFYNAGNTYVFGKGDGHATVLSGGTGVVQLGAGITAVDVLLQADNSGNLTISLKGDTADSLTINGDLYAYNNNGVPNVASTISAIQLADGTSISLAGDVGASATPLQFTFAGTVQTTALTGSNYGANTFDLAPGGDQVTLANGFYTGPETVNFAAGEGTATVNLNGAQATLNYGLGDGQVTITPQGGTGTLQFGPGITAANLVFSTDASHDLFIAFSNSPGDSITIPGAATLNGLGQTARIVFADGSTLTLGGVALLAPDVVVGNITAPAHALSGQRVPVSWTLTNQGAVTAAGPWSDQVFAASDAVGDNAVLLGTFTYQGAIGAGQSVTEQANVTLPAGQAGNEWIVVKPGLSAPGVAAAPTAVTLAAAPNLVVSGITAPSSALSGGTTQVFWTVTNTGTVGTSASSWHDSVYLSLDQTLDTTTTRFIVTTSTNTDPLLASVTNPSYLAPGQSYTSTATITLPQGISGPYYLIIGADAGGQVNADPAGASASYTVSSVFGIQAAPTPDLMVTKVIAPPQAFSGQPLTLNWTVQNNGTVAATASSWTDQILVSYTGLLDSSAIVIGTLTHAGALAAGASYTASATVSPPVGVSGSATFFVVADSGNQVYEGVLRASSTGSTATPTNVALTPPPDLVTTLLTIPATAVAGHTLAFSFKVTNSGATATPNTGWTDSVYLSATPTLTSSATLLATEAHGGALDVGGSYTVTGSATVPAGLSGPVYLIVQANSASQVFELNTANDTAASAAITVANAPPDLVVSGITAPAGGLAAHQVQVAWQVTNTGSGDTAGSTWSDTVVLSASGVLGAPDNVVLTTVTSPAGPLAAGGSYSQSAAIELPLALSGAYTLFVVTSLDPLLPATGLAGSSAAGQAFTVTQHLADLQVAAVTGPVTGTGGNAVTVGWTVDNAGTGPTDATYWYDDVYLADALGNPGVLLGQVRHVNTLAAGASYTASAVFVLPPGVAAGTYSFVVTTDAQSQVTETSHADSSHTSAAVAITAGPNTQPAPLTLAVSNVVLPADTVSGQALSVSYTVSNQGSAATGGFYDAVYLSHNQALGSSSDIYLGYVNNAGLAAGASATNTQAFTVPAGQSGQLYVIVKANAGAASSAGATQAAPVTASAGLQVDLPAVVALSVASVIVPAAATVGGTVTIGYTVSNASANAEQGSWYDALYLSPNGVWSASDPIIGKVLHTGGVAGNSSYTGTLTAQLPGVRPGSYQVVVRTNILSEAAGTNTTGVSAGSIAVDVPTLVLGTPADGTLRTGGSAYYKFTVAAGQTVDLALTTDKPNSINNIYVRHGAMPTLGQYDVTSDSPSVADPNAVIRVTQPGSYYVMVAGNSVDGIEGFALTAHTVDFSVSHITPDYGSNLGSVTLTLDGAKFNALEQVKVVASDGTERVATQVRWVNGTELWATFDLRGLAVGAYDVTVGDAVQGASTLAKAFQVTNGPAGQASVSLVLPQYLRAGQTGVVQVDYANTGQTDIAAPIVDLSTAQALLSGAGITGSSGEVTFLGMNASGPAGILQPGASGSVSFSYTPVNPTGHEKINFTAGVVPATVPISPGTLQGSSTAVDWASVWNGLEATLRPATVDAADWNNVWSGFVGLVGTTTASVIQALSGVATELSQVGQPTNDIPTLLGFELLQASGALAAGPPDTATDIAATSSSLSLSLGRTYSGTLLDRNALGMFGDGWSSTYDAKAATDAGGNVLVQSGGSLHTFTLGANGAYTAASGDPATLSVVDGAYRMNTGSGAVEAFRADGKLASITDAHRNVVSLIYSGAGVLQQVANSATEETIIFTSNAQGLVISATDSNGQHLAYSYNTAGTQLLSVAGPEGVTSYTYAAPTGTVQDNALLSVTNPDGTGQVFTYNLAGLLASQADTDGSGLLTYSYDGAGTVATTNALGERVTQSYGINGAIAQTTDALGNVTQVQSDASGQTTSAVSAGGSGLSAAYDGSGNLISSTDPLGGSVAATYAPGTTNLTDLTTQLGGQTHYTYDAAGDVKGITYQDGSGTTYQYATDGLLSSSTDADGITTAYSYNGSGNLTKEVFGDGTANSYAYDANGNLLTATAQNGATATYTYNAANQLTSLTDSTGKVESYGYNAKGQLASRTEPDGSVTQYSYDASGRLATLKDGSGNLLDKYTYDAAGQLVRTDTGNGASTTYQYDADGRTTEILNRNADGSVASREDYAYNANSQVVSEDTTDGDWTYGYDAKGELTAADFASVTPAVQSQGLSYVYDAAGNRVSETVNGVTTAYTTNALNQYSQVGGTTYTYDADGNTTSETTSAGATTFTYNEGKQLIAQTGPGSSFQYAYDALGNLVATTQNGVTTTYVNDPFSFSFSGQQLSSVAQVYGATGSVAATYSYGLGSATETSGAGSTSYLDVDLTGNIVGSSSSSESQSISYSYLPFGETVQDAASSTSMFGFEGGLGIVSDGSGLLNSRARFYNPTLGRFVTEDPTGVAGGVNLYAYTSNDPINFTDPTGRQFAAPFDGMSNGQILQQMYNAQNPQPTPTFPIGEVVGNYAPSPSDGFFAAGALALVTPGLQELAPAFFGLGIIQLTLEHSGEETSGETGRLAGEVLGKILAPEIPKKVGALVEYALSKTIAGVVELITPSDPNDIIGPDAFGAESLVSSRAALAYTIMFENASTATAPAQNVTVTQQLDTNLNWSTFRLTGFGFDNLTYDLSGRSPFYTAQIDLTATKGYYVDVSAGVNVATGVVTWTFNTVDPATGQAPTNPTVGFLPINDANDDGQAYVSYTVQARAVVKTGDVVTAQASVMFDNQAPINTAVVSDTFDATTPSSDVLALPSQTNNPTFQLSWSGQDDLTGSGISTYTIHVAEDGGPATVWLADTTLTNALFTGQLGHIYTFFSSATDNVGNVEAEHATPDTSIIVGHRADPGPVTAPGTLIIGHGKEENLISILLGQVTPGLAGDTETITAVVAAVGQVSLNAVDAISYVAPASGTDTLTYTVIDQRGDSVAGTVAVTVDPGPAAASSAITVGRDQAVNLTSFLSGLVSPGLPGDTETVTAVSASRGQATLDDQGAVTYTVPATGDDVLTYTVTDQLGDVATGTVAVTGSTPGAPATPLLTIGGTVANQALSDTAALAPFAATVVTDQDANAAETATITLTDANGIATDADGELTGAGLSQTGAGTYTLAAASPAVLTAVLEGLSFMPTVHQVTPGQVVLTGFNLQVTDGGNATASDATTTVAATAVNTSPVVTGTVPGQATSDQTLTTPFASVGVTDPDFGALESTTITLIDAQGAATDADGALTGAGLTETAVGTYTLAAASPAALTSELEGLQFTPTINQAAPGQSVTIGFNLAVTDDQGATTLDSTTSLTVTAAAGGVIQGTVGDDYLVGTAGNDIFDGLGGSDTEYSYGGDDTFIFNQGYGSLEIWPSFPGSVTVKLGPGILPSDVSVGGTLQSDEVALNVGNAGDQILLGDGVDLNDQGAVKVEFADGTVWGQQALAAKLATATPGADVIYGTSLPELIDGQGGGDIVYGGGGGDTFVFTRGYGQLEIDELDNSDDPHNTLRFGPGIAPSDVTVTADDQSDLVLKLGAAGDQITLDGMLYPESSSFGVQQVQFADGTTWNRSTLIAMQMTGTPGADYIYGTSGADILDGKGGGDTVTGNGGDDTFIFNRGYGTLFVADGHTDEPDPPHKVLRLGQGIAESDLTFTADASGSITLQIGTEGDQVILQYMANGPQFLGVQQVQFADGTSLTGQEVVSLALASEGTAGADNLFGTDGADILDGKGAPAGSEDYASGNGGADTFVFNAGYGHLNIFESGIYEGGNDPSNTTATLQFGAGITPAALGVSTGGYKSLFLTDNTAGDQVELGGALIADYDDPSSAYKVFGVAQVRFADGTVWTQSQLAALVATGTTDSDTITGTSGNDLLDGRGGGDTVSGGGGYDTYFLRQGYGMLTVDNSTSGNTAAQGEVDYGPGITEQNLWFTQSGDDLIASVLGSADAVDVKGWFGINPSAQLAAFKAFDGLKLDGQVGQLVTAMATYAGSTPGFDPMVATVMPTDPTLRSALAAAWHS